MAAEWVPTATKTAQASLSLFQALRRELGRPNIKRVVQSLSFVYFMPSGVLRALEAAADGSLDPEAARRVLADFRGDDTAAKEALERLRSENISSLDIDLSQRETLEMIRFGKISIRRDVAAILERLAGTSGASTGEVAELVGRIKALNAIAREVDANLRAIL